MCNRKVAAMGRTLARRAATMEQRGYGKRLWWDVQPEGNSMGRTWRMATMEERYDES